MDGDVEEEGKPGKEPPSRRRIDIEYVQDRSRRHITFSKRKAGIMKKAFELSVLTGTQVLLLIVSESGLVYTYSTEKLQPIVVEKEGKELIQRCLTAPNPEEPT
ncbi:SRF-TF-domain-containing protein, partial [Atractiella rhizophila]